MTKAKTSKGKSDEPTTREIAKAAPDKRRRRNLTTNGKRIPAELKDPEFQSEADMAKRELFAQAYVAHGNLADAAQTAGWSGNRASLRKAGFRLYGEPWVKARIEAIKADLLAELKITQRAVLAELARVGFADMGQVVDEHDRILPLAQMPAEARRALSKYKQTVRYLPPVVEGGEPIEEVKTEVELEGKTGALEKLGKHAGLWAKKDDEGSGLAADEFIQALAEGIARASKRPNP